MGGLLAEDRAGVPALKRAGGRLFPRLQQTDPGLEGPELQVFRAPFQGQAGRDPAAFGVGLPRGAEAQAVGGAELPQLLRKGEPDCGGPGPGEHRGSGNCVRQAVHEDAPRDDVPPLEQDVPGLLRGQDRDHPEQRAEDGDLRQQEGGALSLPAGAGPQPA